MIFNDTEREFQARKDAEIHSQPGAEYIKVRVLFEKDGSIIPLSFDWEDSEIVIEKVLSNTVGMSLKNGLSGLRYKCRAMGKDFYLYFDGQGWYLGK